MCLGRSIVNILVVIKRQPQHDVHPVLGLRPEAQAHDLGPLARELEVLHRLGVEGDAKDRVRGIEVERGLGGGRVLERRGDDDGTGACQGCDAGEPVPHKCADEDGFGVERSSLGCGDDGRVGRRLVAGDGQTERCEVSIRSPLEGDGIDLHLSLWAEKSRSEGGRDAVQVSPVQTRVAIRNGRFL